MPFAASRPAPEIEREIANHTRRMNNNRYREPMLDVVKEVSEATKVYVFNVGPWDQERLLGSLGQYRIRACPEGAVMGPPVVIQGIVREYYPITENEDKSMDDTGWFVAQQILGVGPHLTPRNSFVPFGVFVSRVNPPSQEDVAKAQMALRQTFLNLVNEADVAYSNGPKAVEETIRPETHFLAARRLGKTEVECPWLKNAAVPAERKECPGCGAVYKVGIMKCRDCGYILDERKYNANKANFAT